MKNQEKNAMKMALEIIKIQGQHGWDMYKNIQYKDGLCNITDGRILLSTNLIYDESHEGKLINPKTLRIFKEDDRKFPDLKNLFDSFKDHKYVNDFLEIPDFIFYMGNTKKKICIIYLNQDGFSINKTDNVIAGLDMRYLKMLKYLDPMMPKIKAKGEDKAVVFEYGEPVHTSVVIMPVKI